MTIKTRNSQPIPKFKLNKSIFYNYLTNSQLPTGYKINLRRRNDLLISRKRIF